MCVSWGTFAVRDDCASNTRALRERFPEQSGGRSSLPVPEFQSGLLPALEIEQDLFAPQTATVAAELAALVHHAMARDHDSNAVLSVGVTYRTLRTGRADLPGEFFV